MVFMELLRESRKARKVLLLQSTQSEVLVLTSQTLLEAWPLDLTDALESCALRGLKVRVLIESGSLTPSPLVLRLQLAGAEIRQASRKFPWSFRLAPVQGEIWLFDRTDVVAVNERKGASHKSFSMVVECLMGKEVAHGAAAYFDLRWQSSSAPVSFSVRHKNYALHCGHQSAHEFFGCLLAAKKEISLSLPGSRISKKVEAALHGAMSGGVRVTIYVNAEREDAPALKRLRRLAMGGAVLKICGRRLSSECVVVDGTSVYIGSLPVSWRPWTRGHSPVFLVQNRGMSDEIVQALESQVSVEISAPSATHYAFR